MNRNAILFIIILLISFGISQVSAGVIDPPTDPTDSVRVPLGGNTYLTISGNGEKINAEGISVWGSPQSSFTTFVYLKQPSQIQLELELEKQKHKSKIEIKVGKQRKTVILSEGQSAVIAGDFYLAAGYNEIQLKGIKKKGENFARVKAMILQTTEGDDLSAAFVKDNIDNRFYWGRRGPSVHLSYGIPAENNYEWFYSEITVPLDKDPNGSYYMANGFAEGYFGIQSNSDKERRVLFSVWSPFHTDDPSEIPENQRIKLLKKGKEVNTGEFGNEGSGGQSFLRYQWITGNTYSFLNSVTPDGKGNTIYTAYFFAPEVGKWQLIASFLRPQTDTWYKRPHSFLENFIDTNGYKERRAHYANQWLRDTGGNWVELEKATFSADDIGRRGYRRDFAGGEEGGSFYLRNGGFFNHTTDLGSVFLRERNHEAPDIDFGSLE